MDSLVSGPAAFRLKAYPGAVYETLVEKGRPILQGPMSANHLITEVGVGIPFSLSRCCLDTFPVLGVLHLQWQRTCI
jgi:hypothetical protein